MNMSLSWKFSISKASRVVIVFSGTDDFREELLQSLSWQELSIRNVPENSAHTSVFSSGVEYVTDYMMMSWQKDLCLITYPSRKLNDDSYNFLENTTTAIRVKLHRWKTLSSVMA